LKSEIDEKGWDLFDEKNKITLNICIKLGYVGRKNTFILKSGSKSVKLDNCWKK
jgi:hypothetical protein